MASWRISRIFILLSTVTVLSLGALERRPQHTAALRGTEASLQCASDDPATSMLWTKRTTLTGQEDYIYHWNGDTLKVKEALYRAGEQRDDLVIRSVGTDDTTGFYYCKELPPTDTIVPTLVTALDPPVCAGPSRAVLEGSTPVLSCTSNYKGPLKPRITWSIGELDAQARRGEVVEDSDNEEESDPAGDRFIRAVFANYTALSEHDGVPIYCRIEFNIGDQDPSLGLTPPMPEYSDNCTVTLDVQYPVKSIHFIPNPDDEEDGELTLFVNREPLRCNATGSPPITYRWAKDNIYESDGPMTFDGPVLPIVPSMIGRNVYSCIATNMDPAVSMVKMVTFNVLPVSGGDMSEALPSNGSGSLSSCAWLMVVLISGLTILSNALS